MSTNQGRAAFDNQCGMCAHKQHPDAGYCYMFRTEPIGPCGQHTVLALKAMHTRAQGAIATMKVMGLE